MLDIRAVARQLAVAALITVPVFSVHAQSNSEAVARASTIADSIAGARLADGAPGMIIAVYRDGTPLFRRAYGQADPEHGNPLAADAPMRLASITKQFTAAATLKLIDEGRLTLDAPVTGFVPLLGAAGEGVTVRHLLTQRSGLGRFEPAFAQAPPATANDVVRAIAVAPRQGAPGARFEYNNANYYLLGEIITRIAGAPWERYLADRLLIPAGAAGIRPCDARDDGVRSYLLTGNLSRRAMPTLPNVLLGAAGELCASADDLARWSGALHGGHLLSDTSYRLMVTPLPGSEYAMGTVASSLGGMSRLWHNGGLSSGANTVVAHYPSQRLTVVVLANGFPVRPEDVEQHVAAALLGVTPPSATVAARSTGASTSASALLTPNDSAGAAPLSAFPGTYQTGPLRFVVASAGDGLMLTDPAGRAIPLARQRSNTFCSTQDSTFCVHFTVEAERAEVLNVDSPRAKAPPARRVP